MKSPNVARRPAYNESDHLPPNGRMEAIAEGVQARL